MSQQVVFIVGRNFVRFKSKTSTVILTAKTNLSKTIVKIGTPPFLLKLTKGTQFVNTAGDVSILPSALKISRQSL